MANFCRVWRITALVLLVHAPNLAGGEQESAEDRRVSQLAASLFNPGFESFVAAREELRKISGMGRAGNAPAAGSALVSFAERADVWLVDVGNKRNETVLGNKQLRPGEGRIGIGRGCPSRVVVKTEKKIPVKQMAYLYSYGSVRSVTIDGPCLTDEHLCYLSQFNRLELLDITNTLSTGAFLSKVQLPALRYLHLSDSPVQDKSLSKELLAGLSTVDLMGTLITNKTMENISLDDLHLLNVMNTAVNDKGLMVLADARNLDTVYVDVDDVTPRVRKMLIDKSRQLLRVEFGYYEGQQGSADELAKQFPSTLDVRTRKILPERDYRTRWKNHEVKD